MPYGETPDFYYSGHTGHCFLHYLEFNAIGWTIMSYIALIIMAFTIFTLLVTRVHYSIDIVGGFVFAHLFWILTERYVYIVDYNLAGMPLPLRLGNDDKTI